ncbi:MAG: Uma2 family endonuclease, partial [Oscillatoriales cyanobacterium]
LGIHQGKLRFFTASGELVPTPEEVADSERQQKEVAQQLADSECQQKEFAQQLADSERQQKEVAQQRADRLAAKLRELNIDPDTI